jgi:Fe-S-cluster containining protein
MKARRAGKGKAAPRLRFPEETRQPWLAGLLEMYAITDAGVAAAVRDAADRRGARVACRQGCTVCCRTQRDIAVFPLELTGLSWFCTEKLAGAARAAVKGQLSAHRPGGPCPFLVAGACAVYAVRPMACRRFTVFGEPCAEGEDPWLTRREAVAVPAPETLDRAYRTMLVFHGARDPADQDEAFGRGIIRSLVRNLPDLGWQGLVRLMGDFDARAGEPGQSAGNPKKEGDA